MKAFVIGSIIVLASYGAIGMDPAKEYTEDARPLVTALHTTATLPPP